MKLFKKMAGTSAVFVLAGFQGSSPVERDGPVWTSDELHLDEQLPELNDLPVMANALALEGLEEYDAPRQGDSRYVTSLDAAFFYWQPIRGWIQYR